MTPPQKGAGVERYWVSNGVLTPGAGMTRYGWVFDTMFMLWLVGMVLLCGLCLYGVVLAFKMKGSDGE